VASGFVPLALGRAGKSVFRKSISAGRSQSPPSRMTNGAIQALLSCERHLMHYINFPFGTRIVCWAVKPAMVAEMVPVAAWERKWAQRPLAPSSG
jgi:hypothetical protein